MGQTRAKKSKKASKDVTDAAGAVMSKFELLAVNNHVAPSTQVKYNTSQESSIQNDDSRVSEDDNEDIAPDLGLIEVRSTEDRGLAVFAARKIPAGKLILAETPLMRLTQAEEDVDKSDSSAHQISGSEEEPTLSKQFAVLTKAVQKSYLTLFDSEKSGFSKVKSIYYSNCYNLSGANRSSKSSPGGSCIGMLASRINHSCVPNVQFSFDEANNLMLFHAIKPIPKDRELLSNYDSVHEVKSQRQKRQMLYYGFRCNCEACEPGLNEFWNRSDERRKAMIETKRDLKNYEKRFEEDGKVVTIGTDPVAALQRLEGLLIKEGLTSIPLADTYRSLAKWADRTGDRTGGKKWRTKELDVCLACLGKRAVRVQEIQAKLEQTT